ncbi:AAA family ATPase [Snodgrassella sp. W8132]|uniref:AAA family ATPase n=1 Tax=Snodgrassella sp. W8132 TaxID=2750994 RepID=UPI0018DC9D2D|nr:AAA family ATPase [Snodgrassella sp. W8132]MBI0133674.1 AAA family ATPase [Snodgrassella sp. W8132]
MNNTKQNYWFLEANNNRSDIFIRNNEWIYTGNNKKDIEQIHLIAAGDQVAIKSVSPQISDLPFENKGYPVPVTQIKAIGTVIENPDDGKSLKVSWQKSIPEKKWYFYTSLKTIWPVNKDTNWQSEQLINFTFDDQPQAIDQFCQMPYWQERFNNTNYDSDMNNQNQQKLNNNARWQTTVHYLIQELCEKNNSSIFTRQQFLQEYEQLLQERFPKNNTIKYSISRTFQELRDEDILIFLNNNGQYKLASYDSDISNKNNISSEENPDQKNIARKPYLLDDLIEEGCFISKDELESIQTKLKEKKNIILQGPPGTGKTWLAKRLASVIVGYRNSDNIKAIQFHPNTSYEDFIRGYRPSSDGKLELVDGPFLNIANQAKNDPDANYVIVIEEINRGNPAQIFGEMLTLLEASKRNPQEALELTYGNEKGFYIPDNLFVIGTMNIADRSLAMVDFALRRRFAFFDLVPNFGNKWLDYMKDKSGISEEKLQKWQNCMIELNKKISDDQALGPAFTIGHSYLTTSQSIKDDQADKWFTTIVKTEIMPLLEEYWFRGTEQIKEAKDILLQQNN